MKDQANILDKKIFTPIEFNKETQNHQKNLRSLREILLDQKNYGQRLESYTMGPISESNPSQQSKEIILNRNDLIINERNCQVVNFTDISTYTKLKKEQENNEILKTLNTTVHHEMLAPLRANVDVCQRLLRNLKDNEQAKKMAQIILISSQMVMLHANDLLDQRIIENGNFVPNITSGSIIEAIKEMIDLMNSTLT